MLYLSEEWISSVNGALACAEPVPIELIVSYSVTGGPQGDREHSIIYGPGQPSCTSGSESPSVSFISSWETATAIAIGTMSPQRAFLDGDLKIHGDVNSLIGQQEAMSRFDRCLDEVRASTTYE